MDTPVLEPDGVSDSGFGSFKGGQAAGEGGLGGVIGTRLHQGIKVVS